MEGLFFIAFFGIFFFVIVTFITVFVKGISQWSKNNHSPRLTVEARVVDKQMNTHHHHHTNGHHHHSHSYYITFEVQSGDRMQLSVPGGEFGLLVEGDVGTLTFQGTRYLGFARKIPNGDGGYPYPQQ